MTIEFVPARFDPATAGHVTAGFTGRELAPATSPGVGLAGNLATSQPHEPDRLAADRAAAAAAVGVQVDEVVWMRQVHGADVAVVDDRVPAGARVTDVDGLVTDRVGRPLAVLVADCAPVLLAGAGTVAVAHAGRSGVLADVVGSVVAAMRDLGDDEVHAVIGPAIRGCCYEVDDWLRAEVADVHPAAHATTTWGTPSLDLPAALRARLAELGATVTDLDACTRCDPRWFSHRDPDRSRGRQAGLVVRRPAGAVAPGAAA